MPRASASDAALTAARILGAATEHFAERGFAISSVDAIARAADVTRGAVYHHYTSKAGLFAAVAQVQQQAVAEAIVAATGDTNDTRAALRRGSHAFLDAITRGPAARVLLVDGPAVLSWEDWRRLDGAGPARELRQGLAELGLAPALLDPLTAALSGAMNELAVWLSGRTDDEDARVRGHEALDRLLDAVTG
ncbi:TetR/AcrR family transcriptional regulator [Microbacterium sp. GCS4]|uniref:TetR/AcrR family transcriptional regulator n=1 Tax=Microbacterium sp. GCS4 TaxID=1692239 RepID=UPI000682E245|nr:TetR/AcrR family transcriptional regulator [Microbacterium sp. GCS4]KNY07670.1 TetR family transcriptional regulator [Microbacterium sp. GCS4]